MKQLPLTVFCCLIFAFSALAQEDHKEEKLNAIRIKIQPVQVFTGNLRYAMEFSLSEKKSLELEGNFGLGIRKFSDRLFDLGAERLFHTTYFLARYKLYSNARKNNRWKGFYAAPSLVVGLRDLYTSYLDKPFIWRYSDPYIAGTMDVGYQIWRGVFVADLFVGFGFSFASGGNGDYFSHYSRGNTSYRIGLRTGFVHK